MPPHHQDFGRSVNPISTSGSTLCLQHYYVPPRVFNLPTALHASWERLNDVDEQKLNGFRRRRMVTTVTYFSCCVLDINSITTSLWILSPNVTDNFGPNRNLLK